MINEVLDTGTSSTPVDASFMRIEASDGEPQAYSLLWGIFAEISKRPTDLGWHQNKKRGQCPRFWGISDPPLPPPKRGHFLLFFPLFFAGFWVTGCKFVTQNTVFWHFRNPSRKWWGLKVCFVLFCFCFCYFILYFFAYLFVYFCSMTKGR